MNNPDQSLALPKKKIKSIEKRISLLKEELGGLSLEKQEIVDSVRNDVKKWVNKKLRLVIGGFSVLTAFALYQIYFGVIDSTEIFITDSISEKFSEPRIVTTLEAVAKNQANQIIEQNLNPEISKATKIVTEKTDLFGKDLDKIRTEYDSQLSSLDAEIKSIKERNELSRLGDKAIIYGDTVAFDKLGSVAINSSNSNLEFQNMVLPRYSGDSVKSGLMNLITV